MKKVLIVGAGLAGLALSLALDRKKFAVTIVEKKAKFKRLGFVVLFLPNGIVGLERIGIQRKAMLQVGKAVRAAEARDTTGQVKKLNNYSAFRARFGPVMLIDRGSLYRLLEKRIPAHAIQFDTHITAIRPSKSDVSVYFKDGESRTYDYVIGADGVNSFVRSVAFPKAKRRSTGLVFGWVWLRRRDLSNPHRTVTYYEGNYGLGIWDINDKKKICVFAWMPARRSAKKVTAGDFTRALQKKFSRAPSPLPRILKDLKGKELYIHRDYELDLPKWNSGNILLIGDAAHARSVMTGIGSAAAIEDAIVLGEVLNTSADAGISPSHFRKSQQRIKNMTFIKLNNPRNVQRAFLEYLRLSPLFRRS